MHPFMWCFAITVLVSGFEVEYENCQITKDQCEMSHYIHESDYSKKIIKMSDCIAPLAEQALKEIEG